MKTDTEKTLELLKAYGTKGCHSFVLNKLVGTTRIAARINDLKNQGHNITSVPEKMDGALGCRYFLNQATPTKTRKLIFEGNVCKEVFV